MTKQDQTLIQTVLDADALVKARSSKRKQLLADPATSFWLKAALEASARRDPTDALRDAWTLYEALNKDYDDDIRKPGQLACI